MAKTEPKTITERTTDLNKAVPKGPAFDLGGVVAAVAGQIPLMLKRQELERDAIKRQQELNKETQSINEKMLESQTQLNEFVKPVVGELLDLHAGAEEQKSKLESGSFLDFLSAKGNAVLNPDKYTKAGRAKRMTEINNEVAMMSTVNNVNLQTLQMQQEILKGRKQLGDADYEYAKALEAQGNEVLKAKVDLFETQVKSVIDQQKFKSITLAGLTTDQLDEAIKISQVNPAKVANLGGMDFTQGELEQRRIELEDRNLSLRAKELGLQANDTAFAAAQEERALWSLSVDELQTLQTGGEVAGVTMQKIIDPAKVVQVYEKKLAAYNDKNLKIREDLASQNDYVSIVEPVESQFKNLVERLPQNSPTRALATESMTRIKIAMEHIAGAEKVNAEAKAAGRPEPANIAALRAGLVAETQKMQATVESKLKAEVNFQSAGDKDMAIVYDNFYRKTPIDRAALENVLLKRLASPNPKSLGDVLPPEMERSVRTDFAKIRAELEQSESMSPFSSKNEKDSVLSAKAMQLALDNAVAKHVAGTTEQFIMNQVSDKYPDNPARMAGIQPQTMRVFAINAERAGKDATAERLRLAPEQVNQLANGKDVTADNGQLITSVAFAQEAFGRASAEMLLSLDSVEPGLADKYVKWWDANGIKYGEDTVDSYMGKSIRTGSLQEAAAVSLGKDSVFSNVQGYAMDIVDAKESYLRVREERYANMYSFATDPGNRQAALLQFTPGLEPDEKTEVYRRVIQPLVVMAKQQNLDFKESNLFIEREFARFKSDDPGLERILKRVRAGRVLANEGIEAIMDTPWGNGNDKPIPDALVPLLREAGENPVDTSITDMIATHGTKPSQPAWDIRVPFYRSNNGWLTDHTKAKPYDWYRKAIQPESNERK